MLRELYQRKTSSFFFPVANMYWYVWVMLGVECPSFSELVMMTLEYHRTKDRECFMNILCECWSILRIELMESTA